MWLGGQITFVKYFSRSCAVNLRKINPKVPPQEASSMAQSLYQIIKVKGPLSVSDTWNHAKEAGVDGLNSKTHLKLMLKWMRGRKMLKLSCSHIGSSKKFLHSTLPEEPQTDPSKVVPGLKLQNEKQSSTRKKQSRWVFNPFQVKLIRQILTILLFLEDQYISGVSSS
ncbi:hypothetical protein RJ641_023799 [Dillenia turbinata]|uniref:Uncharacterized protein n=1 Tax=Dillenia turbinata TaxID=194707 RepID=A0AAN8UH94_9MAGN